MVKQLHYLNQTLITECVTLASNAQYAQLKALTDTLTRTPEAYNVILDATHWAMAEAYSYVYYVSIAFGVVSFICACFLGDITKYMDDHVAVVMH